jgi:hypothetical protein
MNSPLISALNKLNFLYPAIKRIGSHFLFNQWIVLAAPSTGHKSLAWADFKSFIPPIDRCWADPFLWVHENIYYVFVEEAPYSTRRGHIACLTLDKEMNILSNQIVLERPYHLSYPFIFKHKGQLYMIPETGENNGVELYRCVHFPDQWEFEKALLRNVRALDATLVEAEGKWWMFANIEENGSTWHTLNLYYADDPLSDQWTPHPLNPVVNDVSSARPAGKIFFEDGRLIRPSQDCSVRYGYAINFNHITKLTETEYAETCEHIFKPPSRSLTIATHTFNDMAGLTVIDAKRRRLKF